MFGKAPEAEPAPGRTAHSAGPGILDPEAPMTDSPAATSGADGSETDGTPPSVRLLDRGAGLGVESAAGRIGAGVAILVVAVLARVALSPVLGDTVPFLLYFPAIVVAASLGGHLTGLLTVLLCALAQTLLFDASTGARFLSDPVDALRLGLFVLNGGIISAISGATFSALRAEHRSRRVAERLYQTEAAARRGVETAERRARILYETAAALSDAVTPEDVADVIIRHGVLGLGAKAGAVIVVSEDRAHLRVLRAHGFPDESGLAGDTALMSADVPATTAIRTGRPVFLEGLVEIGDRFPGVLRHMMNGGTEALAVVPLGPESAI